MASQTPGRRAAARAFKAARGRKGMTQAAVAEAAGIKDRMTIVRFEGGQTWPDAQTQAKLEPIVGMPTGELEDIAARYETDAEFIDRETDLTEQLTDNRRRQRERNSVMTQQQAEILLARQEKVREMYRRRVALLRQALTQGRTDDALTLADELDALLDNGEI